MPKLPGLVKGLGVTMGTMFRTFKDGANTVQYPHVKETPPIRARGVIALREDNCTVCMLCARSCPDWCIYIEGHKQLAPPRRAGGKPRQVSHLDRFDIDYALCMYCGICVEVCPFDALFWSPEYEYSEPRIADLLHDKTKLGEWMETVPEAPELEAGASQEVSLLRLADVNVAQNVGFYIIAAGDGVGRAARRHDQERRPRRACGWSSCSAGSPPSTSSPPPSSSPSRRCWCTSAP